MTEVAKYYTGIGSRETPDSILSLFNDIAFQLAGLGYTLRSGGADGADTAFEEGCVRGSGKKAIYIPWPNFNGRTSSYNKPSEAAIEMASKYHPFWFSLKDAVKKLHARNMHQVLGCSLNLPSLFVVCYTNPNKGGTTQALRCAGNYKIPIFNFWNGKSWTVEEIINSVNMGI